MNAKNGRWSNFEGRDKGKERTIMIVICLKD